jgi:hypothetical protein
LLGDEDGGSSNRGGGSGGASQFTLEVVVPMILFG